MPTGRFYLSVFIILLSIVSCKKEDYSSLIYEDGVLVHKPYLWKISLDDNRGNNGFSLEPSLIYKDQVILAGTLQDIAFLYSVNVENGQFNWKMPVDFEFISLSDYYLYQNQLICTGSGGNIYNINITNGTLNWKSSLAVESAFYITGIDSFFFICGSIPDPLNNPYKIISAWIGNTQTGDLRKFYTPLMENVDTSNIPWNGLGGVERIVPTRMQNNDLFLFIYENRYTNDWSMDSSHYGLFNYSGNHWIYQNKIPNKIAPEVIMGIPVIENQRVIFKTCLDIYCIDLMTGKPVWKTNYNDYFSWAGFSIINEKVYAVIEGRQQLLVCHDVNSGIRRWTTPISGSVSSLEYLNGVIYCSSMSDGRLYAVDAENGNTLWCIKSPDFSGLKPECAVISGSAGEKGKVIVSTFLNGYCFEAER